MLAAIRDLHLLELAAETLRATLDDLAAVVPDWLRSVAQPAWFERYTRRAEKYRLPKGREKREALALEIGTDGFLLLDALDAQDAPAEARAAPMVRTLRDVWRVHYARDDGQLRWRSAAELPPVAERMQSPYDPEAHFSMKRQFGWTGYKVHVTEACDDDAAHLITHVKALLQSSGRRVQRRLIRLLGRSGRLGFEPASEQLDHFGQGRSAQPEGTLDDAGLAADIARDVEG